MADESIATIDRQLLGTHSLPPQRSSFIPSTNHIQPSLNQFSDQDAYSNNAENIKNSKIKSNFNLSFNNSFNTSFAGAGAAKNEEQPQAKQVQNQKPEISYSAEAQNAKGQKFLSYGKINVDVEKLEEQLTTRLIRSSSRDEKFQAVNNTFEEVIRQDRPFGGLLMKIKNAYQEFLQTLSEGKEESQDQILESNGVSN